MKRLYVEELRVSNTAQLEAARNRIAELEIELEKEKSLNALYKRMFEDKKEDRTESAGN